MQKKTHIAAGIAVYCLTTKYEPLISQLLYLPFPIIGALVPDIDLESNSKKRGLKNSSVMIGIVVVYAIINLITKHSVNIIKPIIGIYLFIVLTAIGIKSSHRTFTHSLAGLFMFSISIYLISETGGIYFFMAYLSHIVLDIFNCKKVNLVWPLQGGIYIGLCKTGGMIDCTVFAVLIIMILTVKLST